MRKETCRVGHLVLTTAPAAIATAPAATAAIATAAAATTATAVAAATTIAAAATTIAAAATTVAAAAATAKVVTAGGTLQPSHGSQPAKMLRNALIEWLQALAAKHRGTVLHYVGTGLQSVTSMMLLPQWTSSVT